MGRARGALIDSIGDKMGHNGDEKSFVQSCIQLLGTEYYHCTDQTLR